MSGNLQRERHIKIIGNIFIFLGSLSLLSSFFAFNLIDFFHHSSWASELDIIDMGFFSLHEPIRVFYFFPAFISLFGLLKLVAGLGLINHKPWSEKLSVILAFFMLFNMPIGTAFAIYIFYTLVGLKNNGPEKIENQQSN